MPDDPHSKPCPFCGEHAPHLEPSHAWRRSSLPPESVSTRRRIAYATLLEMLDACTDDELDRALAFVAQTLPKAVGGTGKGGRSAPQ